MDNIITSRELQVERKRFYVELCENARGNFLRITEDSHGRRNTVIIPGTGLQDFADAIEDIVISQEEHFEAEELGREPA